MGSVKKLVKKVARPKVLLPLAAIATGGAALGAFGPAAKAALVGTAGAGTAAATPGALGLATAAPNSLMGSGMVTKLIGTGQIPATKGILGGLLGTGGKLSTGAKLGLGSAGLAGLMMGSPKTEEQKPLGNPQESYDLARLMNQKMGGAYTDAELNTVIAPYLAQLGGEYETITGPKKDRRPMFPGLNYSGLTRDVFVADGGSIKPKKRSKAVDEIVNEAEQREIILDALFGGVSPGANEEAMANQMFDLRRRQMLNPMGRKDGGRIGLANGGDLKYAVESFIRDFPEFEDLESKKLYKEMEKRGYLSDRDEMKKGGLMQLASAPDPMYERNTMMENLALEKFGKSLDRLSNDEVIQIEEMIENMLPMANGGSIPQTKSIPAGMQLNGRGGGFIPMGAQEKKDDVPAMLAKNEFVMTSDAVKAAGGGDINKGAQKMYDLMNSLESKV